jgi:hypothetical protein
MGYFSLSLYSREVIVKHREGEQMVLSYYCRCTYLCLESNGEKVSWDERLSEVAQKQY